MNEVFIHQEANRRSSVRDDASDFDLSGFIAEDEPKAQARPQPAPVVVEDNRDYFAALSNEVNPNTGRLPAFRPPKDALDKALLTGPLPEGDLKALLHMLMLLDNCAGGNVAEERARIARRAKVAGIVLALQQGPVAPQVIPHPLPAWRDQSAAIERLRQTLLHNVR
jgi:hypothetical protein